MTMNLSISRHLLCDTLNFSSPTCTYAKKTKVSFQWYFSSLHYIEFMKIKP